MQIKRYRTFLFTFLLASATGIAVSQVGPVSQHTHAPTPTAAPASDRAQQAQRVPLTEAEQAWLQQNPTATLCVDPDWMPFERVNAQGQFEGIAADLVQLVASRAGVTLQLVPTANWPESLAATRAGQCQVLAFLNPTPERNEWLHVTAPLLSEPNVIITHETHRFVTDLDALDNEIVALPKGTSVAEHLANHYPRLRVLLTDTEEQAMAAVANRQAHMTIRSLNVAAYTIRKDGLFMLKLAGTVPNLDNRLGMGVRHDQPHLYAILDKAARTLTPQERERIVNQHVVINVRAVPDMRWVLAGGAIVLLLAVVGALWWRLSQRAAEQRFHLMEQRLHMEKRHREIQSRLVAMLSHELRTPVSVIAGAARSLELLLPQRSPDAQLRLDRIHTAVNRIVGLSEQFLVKDRVDQGAIQLRWSRVNPATLCTNAISLLNNPRLQFTPTDAPCHIWADAAMLQVAIENLLRNALKYSTADTPVDITIGYEPTDWTFAVRNTGACIAPDMVHTIFEPYTRGADHPDASGAGIGLYLVRRVAALHDGTVSLSLNEHHTVEFTLRLPHTPSGASSAVQA